MEDYTVTRRSVNKMGAWAMPVVLAAVAAPAAQGSQPPPAYNACAVGDLKSLGVDKWEKGGEEKYQGVQVYNNTSVDMHLTGTVSNVTPAFVTVNGADACGPRTPGGNVSFDYTVPAGGSVLLSVVVDKNSDNDACWLSAGCGQYHMKTVGKIDRLGQ